LVKWSEVTSEICKVKVFRDEIAKAILIASRYIDNRYREVEDLAIISSYPSMPLSLHNKETGEYMQAGNWCKGILHINPKCVDFSENSTSLYCGEMSLPADWPNPNYGGWRGFASWCKSWTFFEYGILCKECLLGLAVLFTRTTIPPTHMCMRVRKVKGNPSADLWIATTSPNGIIVEDVGSVPSGSEWIVTSNPLDGFNSLRYEPRHGPAFIKMHYAYDVKNPRRETRLSVFLDRYGYEYEYYAPLYAIDVDYPDDWFVLNETWHDCDVYDILPRGVDYYPYWSKVCLGRGQFIYNNQFEPVARCLMAIHLMNKYQDPNHTLPSYGFFNVIDGINVKKLLRDGWETSEGIRVEGVEANWTDGYGLEYNGVYSTWRVAVFLAAESEWGYGFGDETAKRYADKAAEILLKLQVNNCWALKEEEDGSVSYIFRPDHYGGFLTDYIKSPIGFALAYYRPNYFRYLIDMWNMPAECPASIPTNIEATMLAERALRIYYYYKFMGGSGAFPPSINVEGD